MVQVTLIVLLLLAGMAPVRASQELWNPIAERLSIQRNLKENYNIELKTTEMLLRKRTERLTGNPDKRDGIDNVLAAILGQPISGDGLITRLGENVTQQIRSEVASKVKEARVGGTGLRLVMSIDNALLSQSLAQPITSALDYVNTMGAYAGANMPSKVNNIAANNAEMITRIEDQNNAQPGDNNDGKAVEAFDWYLYIPYTHCDVASALGTEVEQNKLVDEVKKVIMVDPSGPSQREKTETNQMIAYAFSTGGGFGRAISMLRYINNWKKDRADILRWVGENTGTWQANLTALRALQGQGLQFVYQTNLMDQIFNEMQGMQGMQGTINRESY